MVSVSFFPHFVTAGDPQVMFTVHVNPVFDFIEVLFYSI